MNAMLTFRPARPDDEPFLRELRAHVDVERLALGIWGPEDEQLARSIVDLQFRAHAAHYRKVKNVRDTKDCVIELNAHPVGRFIVTQDDEEVYLSDIAVHPAFRGQGIGHAVVQTTQSECAQSKRLLHLHVDRTNPAVQFYLGLGFRAIAETPLNFLLEWVPPSLAGRTMVFAPGGGT